MPAHKVNSETKQQAQTWLLPPYSYSLRQVAGELDIGLGTAQKWRQELVDNGHQLESNKQDQKEYSPEQKFAAVIATAVMSVSAQLSSALSYDRSLAAHSTALGR